MTRLAYAGTPGLAATILQSLRQAGYDISLVLTQPDRPAGRGQRVTESEVKKRAKSLGLNLFQPESLKSDQTLEQLRKARAEALIVAAYGLILPSPVLEMFPWGCINVHASLLPRWRGAAPIQRSILSGDAKTGVSIMKMEAGLDTGPVYMTAELLIDQHDNTVTLQDKLAQLGADTLVALLPRILNGACEPVAQNSAEATYAAKIFKSEAVLDWNLESDLLARQIRAFYGYPVACSTLRGDLVRIWTARAERYLGSKPGEIVDVGKDGILVVCGRGALRLLELQRAGGRRVSADEFARGIQLKTMERFRSG